MTTPTKLELADLVRDCQAAFFARHGESLTSSQRKALRDVTRCRTAALGGHVEQCGGCGHERIAYNSCRNRHCPKCLASQQAQWLDREAESLLPVEYHHVVFTLPSETHRIGLLNPFTIYHALMRSAAEAVRHTAADRRHLGAQVGMVWVLHTWGQTLNYHPHVHGIVTGGGLSCNASGKVDASPEWRSCPRGYFLSVRELSRVFRERFLKHVRTAYQRGKLQGFANANAFADWCLALASRDWVVYSKPPFGGPEQVLKYLARYTHRVAIGNSRLEQWDGETVTFRYQDYRDGGKSKTMQLAGVEFLRRWVQHVLPRGLVKIRHSGFLANRNRSVKREVCRRLLFVEEARRVVENAPEVTARPDPCPRCGREAWLVVRGVERPTCIPSICIPQRENLGDDSS